jgi:glucokinase
VLPPAASIAVAGPIIDGQVRLTNRNWSIRTADLSAFGFADVLLLNDFAALAFAADHLQARDLRTIGPEVRGAPGGSLTILGAGSGFGVSCLARNGDPDRAVVLATEGGSVAFVKSIPTQLIVNPDAALLGAACAARRKGS